MQAGTSIISLIWNLDCFQVCFVIGCTCDFVSPAGFRNEIGQGPENGGQRYVDVPDPVPNNA